jgi:hypothetical protein
MKQSSQLMSAINDDPTFGSGASLGSVTRCAEADGAVIVAHGATHLTDLSTSLSSELAGAPVSSVIPGAGLSSVLGGTWRGASELTGLSTTSVLACTRLGSTTSVLDGAWLASVLSGT